MKLGPRYYTDDRPVKLRSGNRSIILSKNSFFHLKQVKNKVVVVSAGVVYPVDSKYVNALIKRSRAAKVDKEFASAVEFFDLYGLDISNTLRKKTSKFFDTIHAYNVSSGLTSRAYVSGETTYKELPSPVKILISLSCSGSFSTVSAMLVCADKNTAYHSDLIPRVQQICKKFVAYLATKYDVQAERFSAVKSKLANVALPDGSSVSGYSYMYGAKVRIL